jgi:uncharacterized protein with GYD domain
MPHYITLFRFTQKGAEDIKGGPARLDAAKKGVEAAGGKIKGFYLTMGRYDAVGIIELPNDDAMAKIALANASRGTVRGETLRAFTEDEYRKLIASLP